MLCAGRTRLTTPEHQSSPDLWVVGMRLREPATAIGRRVMAFLDFAGPRLPVEVAAFFGYVSEGAAREEMESLRRAGYLRWSPVAPMHYDTTRRWNPDEGVLGGPSGPDTRWRRFHDDQPS